MYKGLLQEGQTLRNCKLCNGCKIMLIGSKPNDIVAVNIQPKPQDLKQEEAQGTVCSAWQNYYPSLTLFYYT